MGLLAWFHRLGSPKWFFEKSWSWGVITAICSGVFLSAGIMWGLFFAPPDYQQGDAFRIIYIHVPAAIIAQSVYIVMAVAYLISWVWKMTLAAMAARAAISFGMLMTLMALLTGALWGKPIWGTYWIWDARLTSMLILLLLYVGVFLLQSAFRSEAQATQMSALLALVGLINIPIIKYSVEWWHTLHQTATFRITEKPAMPASMWLPLLFTVVGYYSFFAHIMIVRIRSQILRKNTRDRVIQLSNNKATSHTVHVQV